MTQAPFDPPASDAGLTDVLESFCPPHYRAQARQLAPVLYADLKRIAHQERSRHINHDTVSTTSLVHDAFLRMQDQPAFETHSHFLRVAAITMRHLLIDRARAQLSAKGGAGMKRVGLEEAEYFHVEDDEWLLAVHEALARLAKVAPRLAEIVECRFFAGYGEQEIAKALGISPRSVSRDWALARAWLYRELGESAGKFG
jgi:RNA polymerase sigma factor (TIGR02999 family)